MNIAIVGNKHIAHDCSARIDVADMVVRISKMDHLDSGLVGTRTDALYLEPNCVWWGYPPERRRLDMLNTIPSIYIRNSWWRRTGEKLISQGILRWDQVHVIPPEVENGLKDCTTFAMAVYDVHRRLPEAVILGAGGDFGKERDRVFPYHAHSGESSYMDSLVKRGVLFPI